MTDRPPQADAAAEPAFILSFPRSGTTLLGQILATAPGVALLEEKPLLARAATDFVEAPDGIERLAAYSDKDLQPYREDFWQRVMEFAPAHRGKRLIDQTALNTVHLPVIGRLFPRAKIVFAIRDPRDVVFSCFRRQFAPTAFTLEFHSLQSTARFYDQTMRLAQVCREKLPLNILDIRYEDLVADFDGETQRLCAFLKLPWSEALRDFQQTSRGQRLGTRSAAQIRRGLNSDSVGHWRLYREQMEPVLGGLAPWVASYGYEPE